jgi:N-acetyl-anhydromuramyl-L-alanine amidase AmpD
MKVTLRIDGKEKQFLNEFVSARIFRNALKLNNQLKDVGSDISVELFDSMIEFVVAAFDKQFTIDDFWDGVEASNLQPEIMRIFNEVLSFGGLEIQNGEGNEQGK